MKAKNTAIVLVASAALIALLGCIQPSGPVVCAQDVKQCPDGSYASRNPALNCEFSPCPAQCGNGICDSAAESSETCSADCPAAEADYYNSEQQAFDALQEEIDGLEEPSASELEAMLGQ